MNPNSLPSERLALVGVIAPGNLAAGAKNSAWIDASQFKHLMAVGITGTLGAGATVDGKWQQADDASGTNAGDIPNGSITQVVKASGDNKQFIANINTDNATKRFVRFVATVGTAASDLGVAILGVDSLNIPASAFNLGTVAQTASV